MNEDGVMYPGNMLGQLSIALEKMGWDGGDDVAVEIAGTSVYEIDGAGTKWAPVKGTRKINKDAFIVIKNRPRNPTIPSVNDDPERLAHHSKVEASKQQSDSGEPANEHSGLVDGRWYRTETLDYTGKEPDDTSLNPTLPKNPIVPSLMFLGVIAATLSVIVAGYIHGNMHLITTLKNAAAS